MTRSAVYASEFDGWADRLALGVEPRWPVRMEFNLSNRCNLQCVQCSGDLSSAIRLHRERRPPLPAVYDDQFFADLDLFLPHLRHAAFAGGEPFLVPENFRIWDRLAVLNPRLACTVITNGTQWNRRVEGVLDALVIEPVVSIDGFSAETFEAVRIGADREQVFANFERFLDYARDRGSTCSINTCVMVQNIHELPQLVAFAEDRGVHVNPLMVHGPPEASLAQLPRSELAEALDALRKAADQIQPHLVHNEGVLVEVLEQMAAWVGEGEAEASEWTRRTPSILQFRRQGAGPDDGSEMRAALARWSHNSVHRVVIGVDERTGRWPPEVLERLGMAGSSPSGLPISVLLDRSTRLDVIHEGPTRYEAELLVGDGPVRVALVPIRDGSGWCDEVHALLTWPAEQG